MSSVTFHRGVQQSFVKTETSRLKQWLTSLLHADLVLCSRGPHAVPPIWRHFQLILFCVFAGVSCFAAGRTYNNPSNCDASTLFYCLAGLLHHRTLLLTPVPSGDSSETKQPPPPTAFWILTLLCLYKMLRRNKRLWKRRYEIVLKGSAFFLQIGPIQSNSYKVLLNKRIFLKKQKNSCDEQRDCRLNPF